MTTQDEQDRRAWSEWATPDRYQNTSRMDIWLAARRTLREEQEKPLPDGALMRPTKVCRKCSLVYSANLDECPMFPVCPRAPSEGMRVQCMCGKKVLWNEYPAHECCWKPHAMPLPLKPKPMSCHQCGTPWTGKDHICVTRRGIVRSSEPCKACGYKDGTEVHECGAASLLKGLEFCARCQSHYGPSRPHRCPNGTPSVRGVSAPSGECEPPLTEARVREIARQEVNRHPETATCHEQHNHWAAVACKQAREARELEGRVAKLEENSQVAR